MRIHSYGMEGTPVIIMLPGSFCNADTMANIIAQLETEFHTAIFLAWNLFVIQRWAQAGENAISRCA